MPACRSNGRDVFGIQEGEYVKHGLDLGRRQVTNLRTSVDKDLGHLVIVCTVRNNLNADILLSNKNQVNMLKAVVDTILVITQNNY